MSIRTSVRIVVPALVVAGLAVPAAAQVQDRPSRPYQGLFGGGRAPDPQRTEQELSLTTTVLGAYGDSQLGDTGQVPHVRGQGTSGYVQTIARYFVGNSSRSLNLSGRGYLAGYDVGESSVGGDLVAEVETDLGRLINVAAAQEVRNEPYLTIGEFATASTTVTEGTLPDSDPTLGLSEERRWSYRTTATAALTKSWTTRQSTTASYGYSFANYPDNLGFDVQSHSATADYNWQYSRPASLRIGYAANTSQFAGETQPALTTHTLEAGLEYRKRLSPSRNLSIGGSLGGAFSETADPTGGARQGQWSPSGRGSIQLDLGRAWAVSADYRRTAMLLERVSVESFFSDTFVIQAGGLIGRRFDAVISGGIARGTDASGESASNGYKSYTGTAQLRWALARCCAALVSYSYYDYDLTNVEILPALSPAATQHGVRVGLTVWVPLIGGRGRTAPER